jgi:hypothetical protein
VSLPCLSSFYEMSYRVSPECSLPRAPLKQLSLVKVVNWQGTLWFTKSVTVALPFFFPDEKLWPLLLHGIFPVLQKHTMKIRNG